MIIKLFEEYSGYLDNYYEKISELEFNNNIEDKIVPPIEDVQKIQSLFDEEGILVTYNESFINIHHRYNNNFSIFIYICEDDWYYVNWTNLREVSFGNDLYSDYVTREHTFYKCDQFDGLIQLLKEGTFYIKHHKYMINRYMKK